MNLTACFSQRGVRSGVRKEGLRPVRIVLAKGHKQQRHTFCFSKRYLKTWKLDTRFCCLRRSRKKTPPLRTLLLLPLCEKKPPPPLRTLLLLPLCEKKTSSFAHSAPYAPLREKNPLRATLPGRKNHSSKKPSLILIKTIYLNKTTLL